MSTNSQMLRLPTMEKKRRKLRKKRRERMATIEEETTITGIETTIRALMVNS